MSTRREWAFNVHDVALGGDMYPSDGDGWVNICTAGLSSSPTVYTNASGTVLSATNGVAVTTIVDGRVKFWTDNDVTSLDISYLMETGECGFIKSATSSRHMLYMNSQYTGDYKLWVPWTFLASSAVTDTTMDLPIDLIITDAAVLVKTGQSADTLDVGFLNSGESGDEDGLLDGMLLTTAGWIVGNGIIVAGSNADHYLHTNGKYGVLLADMELGADTSVTTLGGQTRLGYPTDGTIKSLTYTVSSSTSCLGFFVLTYHKSMG